LKQNRITSVTRYYVGNQIKSKNVLCIDDENNNLGEISLDKALMIANDKGLDLVQISNSSYLPTCKILDYSKFKYNISKKEKLSKKKQKESSIKIKEIKLRPTTGINDLKIKAKQVSSFIEDGCKVKITIVFKGRELSYRYIANNTLNEFLALVPNSEKLSPPSLTGKTMSILIGKMVVKQSLEHAS